jgi:hypothetical protein
MKYLLPVLAAHRGEVALGEQQAAAGGQLLVVDPGAVPVDMRVPVVPGYVEPEVTVIGTGRFAPR